MTQRLQAMVKWFNPKTGYGFITDLDSKEDVFVHHSGISTAENVYKSLSTGEYISYETNSDNGKTVAVNVRGIRDGPLLCESQRRRPRGEESSNSEQ
tara:strand:+ start:145 stop:435 length:291 start_codon:yes stop_codon:yes gene_type:complete